jgi:hypothetical protein
MSDLVERLRELRDLSGLARSSYTLALGEAADEIERLRELVADARDLFARVPRTTNLVRFIEAWEQKAAEAAGGTDAAQ